MDAKIPHKATRHASARPALLAWLAALLLAPCCPGLGAQETGLEDLPELRYLAAAVSDPASRFDTLLSITALARLLDLEGQADLASAGDIEARFREDRAWLDRLAARFGELPMRTALLDPSAWYLQLELDRRQLAPGLLVSPLGPGDKSLIRQLFDRSDERLAAILLPSLAKAREQAKSLKCLANLRDQLNACMGYSQEDQQENLVPLHPRFLTGYTGFSPFSRGFYLASARLARREA